MDPPFPLPSGEPPLPSPSPPSPCLDLPCSATVLRRRPKTSDRLLSSCFSSGLSVVFPASAAFWAGFLSVFSSFFFSSSLIFFSCSARRSFKFLGFAFKLISALITRGGSSFFVSVGWAGIPAFSIAWLSFFSSFFSSPPPPPGLSDPKMGEKETRTI